MRIWISIENEEREPERTDWELMRDAAEGDHDAFEVLVVKRLRKLNNHLRRQCRMREVPRFESVAEILALQVIDRAVTEALSASRLLGDLPDDWWIRLADAELDAWCRRYWRILPVSLPTEHVRRLRDGDLEEE